MSSKSYISTRTILLLILISTNMINQILKPVNAGGTITPGFLEGISNLSFGEKAVLFIPSALGYGERGAGNVIPPNSNIIFEVELFESLPNAPAATEEKK